MGIGNLTPSTPLDTEEAKYGASELRAIKAEIDASFPNFTPGNDVVTKTAAEVNNLADATAVSSALALKAPLASPTFTGVPAAPTATAGTSTTQIANTEFVTTADDLKADAAATTAALALKAPLASPTFTGVPAAPTAALGTDTTQIATTGFVVAALTEIASYDTLFNAIQSLPIGAATEIVGWDTNTNATAKYSEVTGAGDGRMTVATTGTYRIDFCGNLQSLGLEFPMIELRKNGSALTYPVRVKAYYVGVDYVGFCFSALADATASDYFSLYVSDIVGAVVALSNAHFTVQRVR